MTGPLDRAVEVTDRLRSPGGCPWDAAQTHESLTRYLVEECYEVVEAIETGDLTLLREELGDLLFQVLFHARIAKEEPGGFSIDDVAADLADKLVRRHPHVFAGESGGDVAVDAAVDVADLNERWEQRKIEEKGRTSALDGVPIAQPALALAAKLVARARRAELPVQVPAGDGMGERLLALAAEAQAAGLDPETELRRAVRAYAAAIRSAETA